MNQNWAGKTVVSLTTAFTAVYFLSSSFQKRLAKNMPQDSTAAAGLLDVAGSASTVGTEEQEAVQKDVNISEAESKHQNETKQLQQSTRQQTTTHFENFQDLWFADAQSQKKLVQSKITINRKGNCTRALSQATDFLQFTKDVFEMPEEVTQKEAGSDDILASSSHVLQAQMFFEENERFVQLNAKWNGNQPPSYRIEAFSFSNKQLSGNAEKFALQGIDSSKSYDLESVKTLLAEYQKKSRFSANVSQKISRYDGKTNRTAQIFGSVPLSYQGPGEECQLELDSLTAMCFCQMSERAEETKN